MWEGSFQTNNSSQFYLVASTYLVDNNNIYTVHIRNLNIGNRWPGWVQAQIVHHHREQTLGSWDNLTKYTLQKKDSDSSKWHEGEEVVG